jgi:uncharacterized membrane protein HdeD (DUF308 family)
MDKKTFLLLMAFWMVPIFGSMWIDRWWADCIAGNISIVMGTTLLINPRTRNPKWVAIVMIIFGALMEGFAKLQFGFRFLGSH